MEHQINTVNKENLRTDLKILKGKSKSMTNIYTADNTQTIPKQRRTL